MARATKRPAATSAFTSDATLFLTLLRRFSVAQVEELKQLMGPLYKPSLLMLELMRLVCLGAALGETKHVADLQRELKLYGGRATVSRAIGLLEQAGLVVVEPDPDEPRADWIRPSEVLVGLYNRGAPGVIRELRRALAA